MQSNIRPRMIAVGLAATFLLISGFQNCSTYLPLEGQASVTSSARATATPSSSETPDPDTSGYSQNVIDGVCSDDTDDEDMAARYTTSSSGALFGFKYSGSNKAAFWKVSSGNVIHGVVCSITGTGTNDNNWYLAAIGDFNGDGNHDVLWRNSGSNEVAVWLMDGAERTKAGILTVEDSTTPITMDSSWYVEGVGLFDGTGRYGLVWRNSSNSIAIWAMDGIDSPTQRTFSNGATAKSGYHLVGLGDFDGNYRHDLLFRSGGSHEVWFVSTDGKSVTKDQFDNSLSSSVETKVIGDFNGDSRADLLIQNTTSKEITIRYLNGTEKQTDDESVDAPASGWSLYFAQDVTSDSVADWIWTIPGSGDPYLAYTPMSGTPGTTRSLNTVKTGWSLFTYTHY